MDALILSMWWFLPLLLIAALIQTPRFKGWVGERFVRLVARISLSKNTYRTLHDLTIEDEKGSTQIDHVILSDYGIFVLETKHMKGWIYGSANQAQWTQVLGRQKFRFQNPLRQNYRHIKAIETVLGVTTDQLHSVVVFTGNCRLKTPMPPNVTRGWGFVSYIKSFNESVASEEELDKWVLTLTQSALPKTRQTQRLHIKRLAKEDASEDAIHSCPKCGHSMVKRTARKGPRAGQAFMGCSAFPTCRHTQTCS